MKPPASSAKFLDRLGPAIVIALAACSSQSLSGGDADLTDSGTASDTDDVALPWGPCYDPESCDGVGRCQWDEFSAVTGA